MSLQNLEAVRDMHRKHEPMWSGKLGEVNIIELRIDLVSDAETFKSATHRTGPKTRELERVEMEKKFKAGIIEPDM